MKHFAFSKAIKASTSALALAGLLAADAAYAQVDDEIIVTARKKEETLLDAPLAISAFGEVELQEAGFTDIIDISKATPGLFIEAANQSFARVNTTPRFRGVFLSSGNRLQQTATVFLDGIYMSGGIQTLGINELERVEVIKGPQSALFGRNTFAGAINYVTKDPSDEFRADLDVTAATRGEYRLSAGVEGPIAEGVSYRIGGMYESSDGHYDNNAVARDGNDVGGRLGDESQWAINGSLLFEPTENFRLKVRGSYREVDDGAPAANAILGIASHNYGGFSLSNEIADLTDGISPVARNDTREIGGVPRSRGESTFRGTITVPDESTFGINSDFATVQRQRDDYNNDARSANAARLSYNVLNTDDFGLQLDSFRLSANAEFDVSDNIGLSLLAGYNEEAYGYWSDFDLTGGESFVSFISQEIDDLTLEGRVFGSAMDDKLDWTFGANYVDIEILGVNGTSNEFLFFTGFFDDIFRENPFITGAETFGIFGALDYQFTDDFSLSLEGRYQEDRISDADVASVDPGEVPLKITNFLPRVTLRYEPSANTTFYANYSEGNLPGGFNPELVASSPAQLAEITALAPTAGPTFGEESLENFEFGWKQKSTDGSLSFNLAAFFMKRSDEIVRSIELVTSEVEGAPQETRAFNTNGATTNIKGFELDGGWNISDNLSLQGSLAYIDAKIKSYPDTATTGDFGDIFGQNANVEGQRAPRFPPISGSLGATWEQSFEGISGFDTWYTRGDVYYTGNYWASNANLAEADVAVDTNLRTGIRGDNIGLELFVTNLFGEDAPAAANNFADVGLGNRRLPGGFFDFSREGIQVSLRDKRQFGVRANYTFR